MPVNMNELFRDHGIAIELDGDRGVGIPFSAELLQNLDIEDLRAKARQPIVAGDMLTAILKRDENGQFQTDSAGRPKRTGGYLKLAADNSLSILVPRQDEPGEFTRVSAVNTRSAAATLVQMGHAARHEVIANAAAHEKAMEEFQAAVARGETVEEPVLKVARHSPEQMEKYTNFVNAAEAVIANEVTNPFATAMERQQELMASLSIRNAKRNPLTSEQVAKIAEAESLREQIARINPDHELAQAAIVAPYHGRDGEALENGIERIQEAGAGHFSKGVPAFGPTANILKPLMATFTRMEPSEIMRATLSGTERRRFEQLMSRHENTEIADSVRPRIEAIMTERMPDYSCATRFYSHQGADYMMVHDVGGVFVYAADSAARTQELDIERLNRIPTEADVPSQEQIDQLRQALTDMSFDNGAEIGFDYGDEEDVLEM